MYSSFIYCILDVPVFPGNYVRALVVLRRIFLAYICTGSIKYTR